jgi:hypothetical protein
VLVRGGDAVVLSGPARCCYHGVPRVLKEWPPEQARQGDGKNRDIAGGEEEREQREDPLGEFDRHMRDRRINISVRVTR